MQLGSALSWFQRKAATPREDGDIEAAIDNPFPRGGSRLERRRSNQINKLTASDLHGKSKQDLVTHFKNKYDFNGDGIFQDDEVEQMLLDTIEICESRAGLEVEKDIMLNKLRKMNRRMKIMGGTGVVAIIASVLGTYFGSESTFSQGTVEVKDSIIKSKTTSVGLDNNGHSHLQDTKSGLDISTRGFGDTFHTQAKVDPSSRRKLICMTIEEIADLFQDTMSRTEASVVIVGEDGYEKQVVPIDGQFVDNGRTLHFGRGEDSVTMIMDSDVCNTAILPDDLDVQVTFEEEEDVPYQLDIDAAVQDALSGAVEVEEDSSVPAEDGIFNRARNLFGHVFGVSSQDAVVDDPPKANPDARVKVVDMSTSHDSTDKDPSRHLFSPSSSEVLARHRAEFEIAKRSPRGERKMQTSGGSVEICSGDGCETTSSNIALNKVATQSSDISSTGGFASYAVDGDRTTNSHTECAGDQWWEVDLGMMYDINRINVVHRQTGSDSVLRRLRNYYIRFYDDAQERNQVHEINQVDHVQEKAWDVNVSARIVKLFMPAKSNNCLHLAEFEVFGVEDSLSASFSEPTNGWCVSSNNDLPDWFAGSGLYTSETEAPGACFQYCQPFMNMPGFSGMQYNGGNNIGNGYCRCYFDDGYLPSDADRPQGSDSADEKTGSGPVLGHNVQGDSPDNGQRCYSYINYADPTSQTAQPLATFGKEIPLSTAELADSVVGFYGDLGEKAIADLGTLYSTSCEDPYLNLTHALFDLAVEPLSKSSMDSLEKPDGEKWKLSSYLKNKLYELNLFNTLAGVLIGKAAGDGGSHKVLLPQKVCADSEDDLPTLAADVEACTKLDMLNDTDVWAFGYTSSHKYYDDPRLTNGFCAAFNPETKTYALGMSGLIHGLDGETSLELDALAVSIEKQLTATTLNKMWDGTSTPEELTLQGHYIMKGTGRFTYFTPPNVDFDLNCDAKMLVDKNYNNNGNDAILLSGSLSPVINIRVSGKGSPIAASLDLRPIFNEAADYFEYKDGNYKSFQLAASKNLDLAGLCDIAKAFKFFCNVFNVQNLPSVSIMANAYANSDGFGLRLAFEAELELMDGFDIVEDLIGWPDDNKVSASLGVTVTDNMFKACVGFIDSEFCQCENDTNCDADKVCDNTFKVCRKKRPNGGKCEKDSACLSNICVGVKPFGICRECRERGTMDDCTNGEVCQSNAIAANVCGPKKNNGDASGCVSDGIHSDICLSGYCVGMDTGLDFLGYDLSLKYCRECPTAGSSTGCPSGQFCQILDGREVHVCRPKKQNGPLCTGHDACWSGNCVPDDAGVLKYCRVCTKNSHCTGNWDCWDNPLTGFIKKCCKWNGLKFSCYTDSPEDIEPEIDSNHFVEGYTHSSTGGCSGRNELGSTTGGSVQECANSCNGDSQCVSFEYSKSGTTCMRSTTCDDESLTVKDSNDPYHWYLRTIPPPPLDNGGFEGNVRDAWNNYGTSGYTVNTSFKNSGSTSIKVTNGGARQWIQLDAKAGSTINISGYSKAVGTSTDLWDYSIYADVKYADGSNLWGQKAKFTGGTHDWELSETTFTITKDIASISLYALYRNDPLQGTAYFDDISVNVIQPLHTQNYGNVIENGACVSDGDRLPYNSITSNDPVEGPDGLSHDCANFCYRYTGVDGYVGFSLRFKGPSNPSFPIGRCQCEFKQGTNRPDTSGSTSNWWGSQASNYVDLERGNGHNDYVCYPYLLVDNGGFEGNVQDAWTNYGTSGYTISTSFKNSGSQSIKVTNGGARQWIDLDAKAGSTINISGYSKAVGTSTDLWDYSIYADVKYADGSNLWGQKAKFTGGTHGFQFSETTFTVTKDVDGMALYTLYRNDPASGEAYFDDVSVNVASP